MLLSTIFNSFIFILGVSPWFLVSSKSILSESEKRGESAISSRNPEEENIEKLSRHRRNARSRREFLWRTRTIPYEISYSLRKNKEVIYEAIKEIQLKSCLSFVKRKPQDTNWITFELGDGCSSSVGKTYWRKGAQTIILDYPCLQKSTILHEMMHALGFWHEHSRPDRNEHIEIFWENIDTVNEINFEKFKNHEVDTLGIQYDLKSVMHYGNYAFSKNVKQTIKALKDKSITLGNENGLSALDVVKINALYDCSNKMSSRRNFMSSWSDWSSCDKNCYKQRQRFCMASDARKCKRANKHGIEKQVQVCSFGECFTPVDGHWGRWSSWSSCSVTCGEGVRSRSRKCTDPVPKFGGKSCGPKNTDTVKCKQRRCNLGPLDCDFESDSCHWANEASNYLFHWQRRSGETPSRFTGPKNDHTTGSGYYLYTESSFPASKGMVARFSSPEFHPDSSGHEKCMTFWVNFNGAEIGKFAVKQRFSSTRLEKTLWESVGKLGKEWKSIKLTIKGYSTYKIVFEASHPGSYLSDFAIDDVSFKDGACEADSVCAKEERPLGLEAGLINDRRMMATSMKTLLYRPEFARLNNKSAWCVDPNRVPNRHYLVVDLGHDMNVVSIATQGFRNLKSWVNKYQLWYKVDGGRRWTSIVYERKAKIFVGNTDAHSIVKNNFPKPIVARYIGVNPLSWSDSQDICLRLELYGCTLKTHPNRVNE